MILSCEASEIVVGDHLVLTAEVTGVEHHPDGFVVLTIRPQILPNRVTMEPKKSLEVSTHKVRIT